MTARDPGRRGLRFALARVTLELNAALTIGTGGGDDTSDALCVLDANGLPTLPGSSLAGMLREAWATAHGGGRRERSGAEKEEAVLPAERLFGFQLEDEGLASRVELSWAQVHDGKNQPVPARLNEPRQGDPVLDLLAAGVLRDHVRIDEGGVADAGGKFDELLVPCGVRFTFELIVHDGGDRPPREELDELLSLLADPNTRLGGRTRRGFGTFTIQAAWAGTFDLRTPKDRERFRRLPRALVISAADRRAAELQPAVVKTPQAAAFEDRVLKLVAEDLWIFGTGVAVRPEHLVTDRDGNKAHDKVPVTERRIRWVNDRGEVTSEADAEVLVPASGVKGALRHRALFHARRLDGRFAAEATGSEPEGTATEAISQLFGESKDGRDGEAFGRPGRLYLSDVYLSKEVARSLPMQHVSLDRFTQGPMDGLLFSEAPIAGGPTIELKLSLRRPTPIQSEHTAWTLAIRALNLAIRDLAEGRLALGAGGNRGHGYFGAAGPFTTFDGKPPGAKPVGGAPESTPKSTPKSTHERRPRGAASGRRA